MNSNCGYVLKINDPELRTWGYCVNGVIPCAGQTSFFQEDDIFRTKEDAKAYIDVLLSSGWYRDDIGHHSFDVVEVKQYEGLGSFYYTKEAYEKFKEDI